MQIGKLSTLSGMSKDTIRFYEKIGLLPPALRKQNGYRNYPPELIGQLKLLNHAKALGFSLNEITQLSGLFFANKLSIVEMNSILQQKQQEIDQKIAQLQAFKGLIQQTLGGNCDFKEMLE